MPYGDPLLQVLLQWQGVQQGSQYLDTQMVLAPCPAVSLASWLCPMPPSLTWGSGFFVGLAISRRASAPQMLSRTRSWRSRARRGNRSPSSLGKCLVHSQEISTNSRPLPFPRDTLNPLRPLLLTEDTLGQGGPHARPAHLAQRWHCSAPQGLPPGRHSAARGASGTQIELRQHPGPEWTLPVSPPQRTSLPLCSPVSGGKVQVSLGRGQSRGLGGMGFKARGWCTHRLAEQ